MQPNPRCTTCNSCLLTSDDAGKSWALGAVGQQGTRESQVVQLPSETAAARVYGSVIFTGLARIARPGTEF